jgi:hypothetical protein
VLRWSCLVTEAARYPSVETSIDADAVASFVEAVKADPADGVPPTFATVYAIQHGVNQVLGDLSANVDVARMLHGEQDLVWKRPPLVEEVLTTQSRIVDDEMRGPLRRITIESVALDSAGDEVCVARTLLVVR